MEYILLDSADHNDKTHNMAIVFDYYGPAFIAGGNELDDLVPLLEEAAVYCQNNGWEIYYDLVDDISDQDAYQADNPDSIYIDCTMFGGRPCYLDGINLNVHPITDEEI